MHKTMKSHIFSFQWLLLIIIILVFSTAAATAKQSKIARLSATKGTMIHRPEILSQPIPKEFQTFFYDQTIDHFSYKPESFTTFKQRYVMNFEHWGGGKANAPIFAYLGAEQPIDIDLAVSGFVYDYAPEFMALIVFIEHRYYGQSIPFEPFSEVMKNATARGYFDSTQALADYAEILVHIKEKYNATHSPVIVIGGSYGGMLASWFRLKYPHVAFGALASSAPVLYFDGLTPPNSYHKVVTKDFNDTSQTCYQTIVNSWTEIDKVAAQPNGLSILNEKFKTCKPLKDVNELKGALKYMYELAAQYDQPPHYPVAKICRNIDGNSFGSDILSKIFGGVVAFHVNQSCYINQPSNNSSEEFAAGWIWQTCSDLVIPMIDTTDTMFEKLVWDLKEWINQCKATYDVSPRPHWMTTYFGGHDIKLILRKFGSNIIFSNGLRDPYSSGSVLENISDTILAVKTVNGSHCLDLMSNDKTDPYWLTTQREVEAKIIEEWITKYYDDLKTLNIKTAPN